MHKSLLPSIAAVAIKTCYCYYHTYGQYSAVPGMLHSRTDQVRIQMSGSQILLFNLVR